MTYRQRKARRRGRRGARRNPALLVVFVPLLIVGVALLRAVGYVIAIAADTPPLSELKPRDKGETSVVYAADGSRLGYVRSDEVRTPVPWSDMPPEVREATVAIEDERFYEHEGVDFSAIIRAGVKNLESGDAVQGGSTITQQLVRALYIEDPGAQLRAQDPRGEAGAGARGRASRPGRQELDPARVPELGPVRDERGPHVDRHRGRGDHVLLEARAQPRAARVGAARRPPAGALAVQPVPEPDRGARAAQRGAAQDGRQRVHHRRARPRRRRRGRSA